tara:strand:+ start:7928 stop:9550 length:1623 start_codon:yes stop_codon:yes gene_type:complete
MSNTYSGTGGASGLEVRTVNLATDLFGIDIIEVSNGTLTVGTSPNIAVITTGGGGGGGVTTIAFGTTGLTPAAATAGGVTVAGTLVAANGGTSFSTYAQGDIIYASAANTLAKLTKGAAGQVLTMNGGATIPEWAAPTGGIGGTIADTQVAFGTAADTIGGEPELTYIDTAGSRKFNILDSDAGTTTVLYPLKVSRISTGTAAVGLGVGLEFEAEAPAQAGVNVVGSIIESISTAGTNAATTRFDLVIKNLNGSADPAITNEVARFTSNGGFTTTSSVAAGTTVSVNPDAGGTVTVGGTGGVSTTDGPINAGGTTGAITASGTGGVTATVGNIDATAGAVSAGTSVSATTTVSAGSTVTGATGVIATTGGVLATAGNIVATAGNITTTVGSISSATTVTGGTGVIATTGDISATAGSISAIGSSSKIASILTEAVAIGNTDLLEIAKMGKVIALAGDTYTIGTSDIDAAIDIGFTCTFLSYAALATVTIAGTCDGVVAGGAISAVGFTCPQNEPFTITVVGALPTGLAGGVQVFGNVTPL